MKNFGIKRNVEDIQKHLKHISGTVDKILEKNCTHLRSTVKRPYGRKTGQDVHEDFFISLQPNIRLTTSF